MPYVEIRGNSDLRKALRRFTPDLDKELKKELRRVGPKAGGTGKGVSRSNWEGAGEQFINNLEPLTSSVKGRGRLIFKAWAQSRGVAEGAALKAIDKATRDFNARAASGALRRTA